MKFCKICKEEKDYSNFRSSKRHKDGYLNECKSCLSIKRRDYYENNIDRHKLTTKKYYEDNKDEIILKVDREKKRQNDKKYYSKNRESLLSKSKEYYEDNKDSIKAKSKEYYEINKDKINITSERKREIRRRSYKKRKYQYIWREILRKTVSQLKHEKNQTTQELLGYSYEELRIYLESMFVDGMNWENHGDWHVDHIIPISLFREGTEPSIVNRLDNLRPIWSHINLSKGNNIDNLEDEFKYLINDFILYLKF